MSQGKTCLSLSTMGKNAEDFTRVMADVGWGEMNFESATEHLTIPEAGEYTHYCKVCWPRAGPSSATSDSMVLSFCATLLELEEVGKKQLITEERN